MVAWMTRRCGSATYRGVRHGVGVVLQLIMYASPADGGGGGIY
jgi:hypothetical protein